MATSSRNPLRLVALIAALAAASAQAARLTEEDHPRLVAGRPGPVVDAPGGPAEVVTFDPLMAPSLAALGPEESVRIDGWPLAPGVRRSVLLTRHDIYAPDARIVRVDEAGVTEVPRSRLVFFWGSEIDGEGSRLMVSVDPDSGELRALSRSADGFQELVPERGGRHLLGRPEDLRAGEAPTWSCGQEDSLDTTFDRSGRTASERSASTRTPALISSLHTATVAFDTDNELMSQKFSDNTTSATNYIASLVASINVMYERDLLLRLLQGFTVLRVSTVADPYGQTGSPANFNELSEFRDHWSTTYGGVSRAVAGMLSGKSAYSYSASGIAWQGGLCTTDYGYSFSQVFKSSYLAGDTLIVGHEIGHNLTSPHTHCYSNTPLPAPDHCWNGEACYHGATSCPTPQTINGVTNVTGTLMGYCHMLSGCSTSLVFHPRTVNEYAGPAIQGAVGTCVFPLAGAPPTVTGINPPSGAATGGTPVTITGANFVSGATVAIGGVAATGVNVSGATSLTATTGAHASGQVNVVVTNPNTQSGTFTNGYTYQNIPTVTGISPNSGSTLGGTPVTITGTGFVSGATVSLGGTAASSVVVVNGTTITATTGAHAAGTVNVVVTNPGPFSATKTNAYSYVPPPAAGARFYTLTPCRIVDTRNPNGPLGGPVLAAQTSRAFTFAGNCGIPSGATGVSMNVTAADATAGGSLRMYPGTGAAPGTNTISFPLGGFRANNVILGLTGGVVSVKNDQTSGTVNLIVDVNGYFQ